MNYFLRHLLVLQIAKEREKRKTFRSNVTLECVFADAESLARLFFEKLANLSLSRKTPSKITRVVIQDENCQETFP